MYLTTPVNTKHDFSGWSFIEKKFEFFDEKWKADEVKNEKEFNQG
jgi:hypothetical protein